MKKLLVTAFEPFQNERLNSSQQVLSYLDEGLNFKKIILPVSFERSFLELQENIKKFSCTDILMLGQAGGRSKVCLERVAQNWIDTVMPDEDGVSILKSKINKQAGYAYYTSYPLHKWVVEAESLNLPIDISNSAGTYVCNSLSFKVAYHLSVRWLFVHLPYLPEQVVDKEKEVPSLKVEVMKQSIDFIISKINEISKTSEVPKAQ